MHHCLLCMTHSNRLHINCLFLCARFEFTSVEKLATEQTGVDLKICFLSFVCFLKYSQFHFCRSSYYPWKLNPTGWKTIGTLLFCKTMNMWKNSCIFGLKCYISFCFSFLVYFVRVIWFPSGYVSVAVRKRSCFGCFGHSWMTLHFIKITFILFKLWGNCGVKVVLQFGRNYRCHNIRNISVFFLNLYHFLPQKRRCPHDCQKNT